jgi:hypothetical protein
MVTLKRNLIVGMDKLDALCLIRKMIGNYSLAETAEIYKALKKGKVVKTKFI